MTDLREALSWRRDSSLPGIALALKRRKVSRQRGYLHLHSPDLAYQQKMVWLEHARTLAFLPERRVVLLSSDEVSFYRQPTLADRYALRGQAPLAHLAANANTRYRVGGALNALTGQLTWLAHAKIGVVNLKRFLTKVRRTYPEETLVLAWDNWPIHLHPAVLETAADLEIQLLWLPTYAPWTNPIEKVWRKLKQELLHHHRLADQWTELKQRVKAWLEQFTQPSPGLLRYCGLLPK